MSIDPIEYKAAINFVVQQMELCQKRLDSVTNELLQPQWTFCESIVASMEIIKFEFQNDTIENVDFGNNLNA